MGLGLFFFFIYIILFFWIIVLNDKTIENIYKYSKMSLSISDRHDDRQ